MEGQRHLRRRRWLELQAAYPDAGRKEIRTLDPATYTWLYRNDNDWMLENVPAKRIFHPVSRLDWNSRDTDLAAAVRKTAKEILLSPGKKIQITISTITRRIGIGNLFVKNLSKLPMTKTAFEEICETADAFKIRRVRYVVDHLLQQRLPIRPWRIIRKAGLSPGFSEAVAREIERLVEEYG